MIYYYFYKSIGQVIQTTFRCKSWQSDLTRDLHFHVVINNLPFKFQLSLATACLWMIFFHGRWLSNKKNHKWKYEKCCNYSMLNISFNFFGLFQNYDLSVDLHWLELVINQGLSALLDYRNIKRNPIIILSEWLVNLGWRVVPKGAGFHSRVWGPGISVHKSYFSDILIIGCSYHPSSVSTSRWLRVYCNIQCVFSVTFNVII